MRSIALPFLAALLVCVSGCGDDRGDRRGGGSDGEGGSCTLLGCSSAVAIHLGDVLAPLPKAQPLSIHACVGSECVDVQYAFAVAAAPSCTALHAGLGAGPTVECVLSPSGDISLQITLLEDPGTSPVVAISVTAGSTLLASHAQPASLLSRSPNGDQCGPVCSQGEITFAR